MVGKPEAAVIRNDGSGGGTDGYDIDIAFTGDWSAGLRQAFVRAADRLETIIESGLSDVGIVGADGVTVVDDILITAALEAIDGRGGILGSAAPTAVRPASLLPATGHMRFDAADAASLNASAGTTWDAVVLHEMLHVLGFGTLWTANDLVSGADTPQPVFTGPLATAEYGDLWSDRAAPAGVPLAADGTPATAYAHWDEQTFGNEIATPYLDPGANPLSAMTAASLGDLGYDLAPRSAWQVDGFDLV
jgi:hypothetical protein